jgi:hypothetical protein
VTANEMQYEREKIKRKTENLLINNRIYRSLHYQHLKPEDALADRISSNFIQASSFKPLHPEAHGHI